jgi:ERCC4-type nuclease
MFTLLIDVREKTLYKELNDLLTSNPNIKCSISLKPLDIGDAIIADASDNFILIFERKTIPDLLSSIKDGRYLEQSYRLQQCNVPNHCITYIIEGSLNNPRYQQQQNTIISCIYSLNYCKTFSTLRTLNVRETAIYLLQYLNKINKQKDHSIFYNNTSSLTDKTYSDVIKTSKKSNITTSNIGEIMLMQIPGVSTNCAKAIMEKYETIINLIVELQENDNCLEDISIINDKSISRKITKTAIQNIKIYLMQ